MRLPALILAGCLAAFAQTPDSNAVPFAPSAPAIPTPAAPAAADSSAPSSAISPSEAATAPLATSTPVPATPPPAPAVATTTPAPAAMAVPAVLPVTDSALPSVPVAPKYHLKRLPQVAVLLFTGEGIEAKDLSAVTNRFESELLVTDSAKVVERRNINQILKEQGFQQSGACDNSECSVEIGQLLSVDGIYTGELAKVGKTWSLSVKRTSVGSGQTEFSHVLDIQGSLEDVLRGGVPEMALIASGKKKPGNNHTVLIVKGGSVWPWIVGGVVVAGGAAAAAVLLTQEKSSSSTPTRNVSFTWSTAP